MPKSHCMTALLLLLSLICHAQKAAVPRLGSPLITNYASDFYSVAGKNWEIAQGQDGKMYFANNYGLVEFDGYDWERVGQPP